MPPQFFEVPASFAIFTVRKMDVIWICKGKTVSFECSSDSSGGQRKFKERHCTADELWPQPLKELGPRIDQLGGEIRSAVELNKNTAVRCLHEASPQSIVDSNCCRWWTKHDKAYSIRVQQFAPHFSGVRETASSILQPCACLLCVRQTFSQPWLGPQIHPSFISCFCSDTDCVMWCCGLYALIMLLLVSQTYSSAARITLTIHGRLRKAQHDMRQARLPRSETRHLMWNWTDVIRMNKRYAKHSQYNHACINKIM